MSCPKSPRASLGFWQKYQRHVEITLLVAVLLLTILQLIWGNLLVRAPRTQRSGQLVAASVMKIRNDASNVKQNILLHTTQHEEVASENNRRVDQTTRSGRDLRHLEEATRSGFASHVQTSLDGTKMNLHKTLHDVLDVEETNRGNIAEALQATNKDSGGAVIAAKDGTSGDNESAHHRSFREDLPGGGAPFTVESTAVTAFKDQVQATVAQDTILRKQAFLKKYIDCKKENGKQSVGDSCALQLRIPEAAADSMNFDYMNAKLESDRHWLAAPHYGEKTSEARASILIWRIAWSIPKPDLPETLRECPVCRFTTDETDSDAAAVVMSSYGYRRSNFTLTLPTRQAYPRAKMVVYEYESPFRSGARGFTGLVDYTFGYRRDCDVVKTNGYMRLRKEPVKWSDIVSRNAKKFKMAAWFVSNCDYEESERSYLARSLQRYGVQVDVYGRCGNLTCAKGETQCLDMLETDYKFYFSFENSLCNHYVTEKFYKALRYSVVPVTYGLGHELTGFPKTSYIDVFDFPDVKSLADYIIYLDSNTTAYNEYFRWQLTYEVDLKVRLREQLCQLCRKLVEDIEPERQYHNFESWAIQDQCVDVNVNTTVGKFIRGLPWSLSDSA